MNSVDVDRDYLASAGNYCVIVWNMKKRKHLYDVEHGQNGNGINVFCVKMHDEMVISASDDHTVKLSNRSDGQLLHTLQHDDNCYDFDISDNILAVATSDGVFIWSLNDRRKIKKIDLGGWVDNVRYVKGRTIIAVCTNGEVHAIDME